MLLNANIWSSVNANLSAICSSQSVTFPQAVPPAPLTPVTPINLLLNGSSQSNLSYPFAPIKFPGFFRNVQATVTTFPGGGPNLTLTVNGTYSGQLISEQLTFSGAGSQTTTNFFDSITSISASIPSYSASTAYTYSGISVGMYNQGGLTWKLYDYNQEISTLNFQVIVPTGQITWQFVNTYQDVGTTPNSQIVTNDQSGLGVKTESAFGSTSTASNPMSVLRYYTIIITGGGDDDPDSNDGTLQAYFLQSGI